MKVRHALALVSAALVLATTAAAHAAGPPYTVAVGGSATGTQAITFASSGTVQFSVKNNAGTVLNLNCSSVTGNATVTKGVGVNPIAAITSTTWTGCRIPGMPFTVTQGGVWDLAGTGSNATAGTETIGTQIPSVALGFAVTANPAVCSFTVTGHLDGSFNEATQQLLVSETGYSGDLALSNVGPCLGQMQSGNAANMIFSANVSTGGAGAINLS